MGWEIFQSIEKNCKTRYGYGAHPDVKEIRSTPNDKMESFFLGETLKYLYLLMDPDSEVSLNQVSSSLNHIFFLFFFWLFKLYLTSIIYYFCPRAQYVFNTEAHPIKVLNL